MESLETAVPFLARGVRPIFRCKLAVNFWEWWVQVLNLPSIIMEVENSPISKLNTSSRIPFDPIFHWTMIMGGRVNIPWFPLSSADFAFVAGFFVAVFAAGFLEAAAGFFRACGLINPCIDDKIIVIRTKTTKNTSNNFYYSKKFHVFPI